MPDTEQSPEQASSFRSDKPRKKRKVDAAHPAHERFASESDADQPSKKKKRLSLPDVEIEVDVNAPEPPSKKALRKAKKLKDKPDQDDAGHILQPTGATTTSSKDKEGASSLDDHKNEAKKRQQAITYSIWIGNLPFTITKPMLTTFLTSNAKEEAITSENITRINLPASMDNKLASKGGDKPVNRGFAYVDFASQKAMDAALALTETSFGGRKVLIKDAKNFEGRPNQPKASSASTDHKSLARNNTKPTRRIFVGNLGFDVTREDLSEHFSQCGFIENVHMATFEDTGKCKGFAWITFTTETAAEAAARGWVIKSDDDRSGRGDREGTAQNQTKGRKWFVNRLMGRPLRCELAEDATTRYQKRFGKNAKGFEGSAGDALQLDGLDTKRSPRQAQQKLQPSKHKGHSSAAYGGDGSSSYRTGAIATPEGQKIVFD